MRSLQRFALGVLMAAGVAAAAHLATAQSGTVGAAAAASSDYFASADMAAKGAAVLSKAKAAANGSANETLATYPGHFINLTARIKSGGGELHQHYNDIFIVLDGEATELTGGTLADAKMDSATGEGKGTAVVGGTVHKLAKGDVLHILYNTPHQMIVEPGKSITMIVVKVRQE